jgi:RNA 3'-phosphate cyclase
VVWRALRAMGFRGQLNILREGFYPRGGGLVDVLIEPVLKLRPIKTDGPREVEVVRGVSVCGRLPSHVAERQARAAIAALREAGLESEVERRVLSGPGRPFSPGSYITLWVEADSPCYLGADALGERGKRAERVGLEAAESLLEQLRTGMAVDLHTADNLILWCSLADGESSYSTSRLTLHITTAMELARIITGVEFEAEGELGEPAKIRCRGLGLRNPNL